MSDQKKTENILDDALENLTLINNPIEARKVGINALKKVDISHEHWIGQCSIVKIFSDSTSASERKIAIAFGISKSEIHRMLGIAKLPSSLRMKAKEHNVEKWVLSKLIQPLSKESYQMIYDGVMNGTIKKYSQVKGMK